jgi:hypothetical protein
MVYGNSLVATGEVFVSTTTVSTAACTASVFAGLGFVNF